MVVDLEVTAFLLQHSLEPGSAIVGCPGKEAVLLECVALDLTVHHFLDRPVSELVL